MRLFDSPSAHGESSEASTLSSTSILLRSSSSKIKSALEIPFNAWDSHMHVLDPENFSLDASAIYRPKARLLPDAVNFETSLGIPKLVLVQPSIYGTDNSCLESNLRKVGPKRGRGVVAFDPYTVSERQMKYWHELGVRGVRLNLSSTKTQIHPTHLRSLLQAYADRIRPLNWTLQLYMPLSLIEELEDIISTLGTKIVLDHFGHPDFSGATFLRSSVSSTSTSTRRRSSSSGSTCSRTTTRIGSKPRLDISSIPGLPSLLRLLQLNKNSRPSTKLYIKLSAPYHLFPKKSSSSSNADSSWVSNPLLEAYTKLLLQSSNCASKYLLFATDWPFTRFDGIDIRPFINDLKSWCSEIAQERVDMGGPISSVQDISSKEQTVVYHMAQTLMDDIFRNAAEDLWEVLGAEADDHSKDKILWTSPQPKHVEFRSSI